VAYAIGEHRLERPLTDRPATSHLGDLDFVNVIYAGFIASLESKYPGMVELHDGR
jgi:hypothetical protein